MIPFWMILAVFFAIGNFGTRLLGGPRFKLHFWLQQTHINLLGICFVHLLDSSQ